MSGLMSLYRRLCASCSFLMLLFPLVGLAGCEEPEQGAAPVIYDTGQPVPPSPNDPRGMELQGRAVPAMERKVDSQPAKGEVPPGLQVPEFEKPVPREGSGPSGK